MNPLVRDATGPIKLQEARILFRDLAGKGYDQRTMIAAWHAFRIGIAIAEGRTISIDDQLWLRRFLSPEP